MTKDKILYWLDHASGSLDSVYDMVHDSLVFPQETKLDIIETLADVEIGLFEIREGLTDDTSNNSKERDSI